MPWLQKKYRNMAKKIKSKKAKKENNNNNNNGHSASEKRMKTGTQKKE